MTRNLDNYKSGEYKSNIIMNVIQTILIILGITCLFFLPLPYGIESVVEPTGEIIALPVITITTWYSPFKLLIEAHSFELSTFLSVTMVIYVSFLFINLIVSLFSPNVSKSSYIKVGKIIEVILGIVVLGVLYYYLLVRGDANIKGEAFEINNFVGWQCIVLLNIFGSLLNYFNTKKISIYD